MAHSEPDDTDLQTHDSKVWGRAHYLPITKAAHNT